MMRPRAVGGYEPDEQGQHELSELWHTSRTALALDPKHTHYDRVAWCVAEFIKAHGDKPNVKAKWVYNWAIANLGVLVRPQ